MGSITKREKVDKRTGKVVVTHRAYVRREGFASKSKVCKTEREAKEWLRENDATASLQRKGSGKLFTAVVEDFVEAPPMRGTKYWSAQHLDYWKAELGVMRIADITRGDINAAKAKLQRKKALRSTPAGPKVTDQKLRAATVNRYLASLSSVFNYAVELEIIDNHPMKAGKVKKLEEGEGRRRVLTPDEEARLLAAAQKSTWPMLGLFVLMCMTSVARKSEVLKLTWSQIHLEDAVAILPSTKNGKPRALPLVREVRVGLAEAKKVRPLHSEFVFFDPKDPTKPKNIDTVWKKCRADAGLLNDRDDPLDKVVLHTTRHTGVTKMLRGGANLAQAARVSGHQTLAMLKKYEHMAAQDAVDLAEKLLSGPQTDTAR